MSDEGKQDKPKFDKKHVGQETLQGFKDQTRQEQKEILSEAKQFDKDSRDRDGLLHVKIERLTKDERVYADKLREDFTDGLQEKDRRIDKTESKGNTLQIEVNHLKKTVEKIDPLQTQATTLATKLTAVESAVTELKAADQKSGTYDTRLATLIANYNSLKEAVKLLTDADPHDGVPWYARPGWIAAVGVSIAGVITAISMAFGGKGEAPPAKETDKKDTTEKTAPENPGKHHDHP